MNNRVPEGELEATVSMSPFPGPSIAALCSSNFNKNSMSDFHLDDTIGALASAAGGAGRGIIRISGPASVTSVSGLFQPADKHRWQSANCAMTHTGVLRLDAIRAPIPVVLYLWPGVRSYTGQRLLEIHAVGSPPLLEAILVELFRRGVRPAAPGEFTLRAFLSGRIDLVQAEAVLGVIDAADTADLRAALRQLAGGVSGRIARLSSDLLDILADLEAGLDFADEGIQFISREEFVRRISAAEAEIDDVLAQCDSRMESTGRMRVVLAGLPNAGKSTLFNALIGRDAALVSRTAGTTRDYLCSPVDWEGMAVELVDTAGWEENDAAVASPEGVSQAAGALGRSQWERADLILWCSACDLSPREQERDFRLLHSRRRAGRAILVVRTKGDLHPNGPAACLTVCAASGAGLAELVAECVRTLGGPHGGSSGLIGTTTARCRESLVHSRQSLSAARSAAEQHMGDELVALEIRETSEHLGRILGTVYTNDILDRVFSRFCIGK